MTCRAIKSLRNDRYLKIGIPFVKLRRQVRYDVADILQYMDSHKIYTRD